MTHHLILNQLYKNIIILRERSLLGERQLNEEWDTKIGQTFFLKENLIIKPISLQFRLGDLKN